MQVNTVFKNGLVAEMDEFVGEGKTYSTYQELIREAIRDKLRALKPH